MANGTVTAKANVGAGTETFAVDNIGGVLFQRGKIAFGAEGEATDVSAADPLPVDVGTPTVSLSAGSLSALENITVELGSTSLAALESVTATGPLTDAQLRATDVPVSLADHATETTLATIAGVVKAEDSAHVSGHPGIPMFGIRQLADTPSSDTDGDYTLWKFDEEGRGKVATKPASFTLVTGNITANAQTVFCDVSRASNVQIHMVATSLVGHNATFEGSLDSTNGTDGAWFAIQVVRSNANTIELVTGVLAATPAYAWEASVNGLSFIRVRATAHTSGTATWKFQRGSYATEPIPAAQISGTQPVSGSVTVTASTPATPTASIVNSAATTNGTVVKASAGTIYGVVASNTNAATRFLKFHNSASVTVGTTAVALTVPIPTNSVVSLNFGPQGMRYGTGICLSITGAAGDTDATAIAANEVKVNTAYI